MLPPRIKPETFIHPFRAPRFPARRFSASKERIVRCHMRPIVSAANPCIRNVRVLVQEFDPKGKSCNRYTSDHVDLALRYIELRTSNALISSSPAAFTRVFYRSPVTPTSRTTALPHSVVPSSIKGVAHASPDDRHTPFLVQAQAHIGLRRSGAFTLNRLRRRGSCRCRYPRRTHCRSHR
jgi:hypothetical protein